MFYKFITNRTIQ